MRNGHCCGRHAPRNAITFQSMGDSWGGWNPRGGRLHVGRSATHGFGYPDVFTLTHDNRVIGNNLNARHTRANTVLDGAPTGIAGGVASADWPNWSGWTCRVARIACGAPDHSLTSLRVSLTLIGTNRV